MLDREEAERQANQIAHKGPPLSPAVNLHPLIPSISSPYILPLIFIIYCDQRFVHIIYVESCSAPRKSYHPHLHTRLMIWISRRDSPPWILTSKAIDQQKVNVLLTLNFWSYFTNCGKILAPPTACSPSMTRQYPMSWMRHSVPRR